MFGIGMQELLIVLLFFGDKMLPEIRGGRLAAVSGLKAYRNGGIPEILPQRSG
jgi:Sec-independent protein translocase protein TatA